MFATVVISILLAAVVAAVIWNLRSKKKRGKSSCGCGCSGCGMSDICHKK